jgi:hypothetical protein
MNAIRCSQCGKDTERVASMSGSIMGDEYTETYWFCGSCQVYTKELCREPLDAPETVHVSGPISKKVGDAQVKLMGGCENPWDKRCRCESHLAYFGGGLD